MSQALSRWKDSWMQPLICHLDVTCHPVKQQGWNLSVLGRNNYRLLTDAEEQSAQRNSSQGQSWMTPGKGNAVCCLYPRSECPGEVWINHIILFLLLFTLLTQLALFVCLRCFDCFVLSCFETVSYYVCRLLWNSLYNPIWTQIHDPPASAPWALGL